jgi:hypothetical protein
MMSFQEKEFSAMIEAVKRDDLKGVEQNRRIHLQGILIYLSDSTLRTKRQLRYDLTLS